MNNKSKLLDSIKQSAKAIAEATESTTLLVPSGSTLLNLACSGSTAGAYKVGKIVNIIGDSSAGKSIEGFTLLAECANNPAFDKHELIYDDVESANSFNLEYLFGEKAAKRIILEEPCNELETFFHKIMKKLDHGTPFIYVLDSLDALTTVEEEKKTKDSLEATVQGKKSAGSYGMQKPKLLSQLMRMIKGKLRQTNSLLLIVSQVRVDINPMTFSNKTRSGGKALEFYSSVIMWLAIKSKLVKTVKDVKHQIGVRTKIKVTKCRDVGRPMEVPITIHFDYGIDNITDCVDYLIENKEFVKVSAQKIKAPQFKFEGTPQRLVKYIEENGLEDQLDGVVNKVWKDIEAALRPERKRKF